MNFELDSSSRVMEDLGGNLKSILESVFAGAHCQVDDVKYDPKSNPNRFSLRYHDDKTVKGVIELFINSRESSVDANIFRSIVNVRQSSVRQSIGRLASQSIVDYAVEWNLQPKEGGNIIGTMNIFSYLEAQDPLYFERP